MHAFYRWSVFFTRIFSLKGDHLVEVPRFSGHYTKCLRPLQSPKTFETLQTVWHPFTSFFLFFFFLFPSLILVHCCFSSKPQTYFCSMQFGSNRSSFGVQEHWFPSLAFINRNSSVHLARLLTSSEWFLPRASLTDPSCLQPGGLFV